MDVCFVKVVVGQSASNIKWSNIINVDKMYYQKKTEILKKEIIEKLNNSFNVEDLEELDENWILYPKIIDFLHKISYYVDQLKFVKRNKEIIALSRYFNTCHLDKTAILENGPTEEDIAFYNKDKPVKIKEREEAGLFPDIENIMQRQKNLLEKRRKNNEKTCNQTHYIHPAFIDQRNYINIDMDEFLDEIDEAKKFAEQKEAIIDKYTDISDTKGILQVYACETEEELQKVQEILEQTQEVMCQLQQVVNDPNLVITSGGINLEEIKKQLANDS